MREMTEQQMAEARENGYVCPECDSFEIGERYIYDFNGEICDELYCQRCGAHGW